MLRSRRRRRLEAWATTELVAILRDGASRLLRMRAEPACLLRRLMGDVLHLRIDEIERRGALLQHAPALEPVVGALHLVARDRRWIAYHEPALAQVLRLERGDFGVGPAVIVDEIVHIGALVG